MSKLKILSSALVEIATIEAVLSASKTEVINADNTLSFSMRLNSANAGWINDTNVIGIDSDYYDIAKYKNGHASNGDLTVQADCEHVSYRLNNAAYNVEYFTETGTPTAILAAILAGTPFSIGTVEFTAATTYSIQQAMSRRGLTVQFAELLGGELLFSGFTVSILSQRGSAVAKDLMIDRNIEVVSKSVDKMTLDESGNPTVAYECSLIQPMALALGDVVTMAYATLGIDVSLRIVSITTNPYDPSTVSFSVSNTVPTVEDAAYQIATETVSKDAKYNGCRIGPEYGFEAVRNDKKARAYMNSTNLALQTGDGTGNSWTNKLYYSVDEAGVATLVFDGTLSATVINALSALISPNLYAGKATISELTVDELDTSDRVQKYLNTDVSDDNYQRIYDQMHEFITASTDGLEANKVQATNRDGQLLYWLNEASIGTAASTEVTAYPVWTFNYTPLGKLSIGFLLDPSGETQFYFPIILLGAGTGVNDNGKGFLYEGADGLYLGRHHSTTGEVTIIKITDAGIDLSMFPTIVYNETTVVQGIVQVWVQPSTPSAGKVSDVWIDSDDITLYDKKTIGANTALAVTDAHFITVTSACTVTLHAATTEGIPRIISNKSTGYVSINGTICGRSDWGLLPGETFHIISDGSEWVFG